MVIIVGIEVSSKSQSKVNPLHVVWIVVVVVVIKVNPTKSLWAVVVVVVVDRSAFIFIYLFLE